MLRGLSGGLRWIAPAITLDQVLDHCLRADDHPNYGPVYYCDFPEAAFGPHLTRDDAVAAIARAVRKAGRRRAQQPQP